MISSVNVGKEDKITVAAGGGIVTAAALANTKTARNLAASTAKKAGELADKFVAKKDTAKNWATETRVAKKMASMSAATKQYVSKNVAKLGEMTKITKLSATVMEKTAPVRAKIAEAAQSPSKYLKGMNPKIKNTAMLALGAVFGADLAYKGVKEIAKNSKKDVQYV